MKHTRIPALCLAVFLPFLLSGCGEPKTDIEVSLRNLTEHPIETVNFAQRSDKEHLSENIVEETFPSGLNLRYAIGSYTEKELEEGFTLHVVSKGNFDENFSGLQLKDGDTVVLYMDEKGLSLAFNKSDMEIKALQAKSKEEDRDLPPVDLP
ncbi:MAG: hypothetical protein IK130_02960 [Oscillospiraceae bacterium]|nr:hypothetical protein [Oscillospiraceae bacterium]